VTLGRMAHRLEVSQPTISRAITSLTGVLGWLLTSYVPVPEDLDEWRQYIVDVTLLPYWSWAGQKSCSSRNSCPVRLSTGKSNSNRNNAGAVARSLLKSCLPPLKPARILSTVELDVLPVLPSFSEVPSAILGHHD
jgi:hypothetical protein